MLSQVMLRLSADPVARANAGIADFRGAMRTCKLVWHRVDRAIEVRDRAQQFKENAFYSESSADNESADNVTLF